jgi:hypothetical protein
MRMVGTHALIEEPADFVVELGLRLLGFPRPRIECKLESIKKSR